MRIYGNLQNILELLDNLSTKIAGRTPLKKSINEYWKDRIITSYESYSTLDFLNAKEYCPGHVHCVLKLTTNPVRENVRLTVKLKLFTDRHIHSSIYES